jgi:hypothetical protein
MAAGRPSNAHAGTSEVIPVDVHSNSEPRKSITISVTLHCPPLNLSLWDVPAKGDTSLAVDSHHHHAGRCAPKQQLTESGGVLHLTWYSLPVSLPRHPLQLVRIRRDPSQLKYSLFPPSPCEEKKADITSHIRVSSRLTPPLSV